MNCHDCGGTLREVEKWQGEREFTLYRCQSCGQTGGEASGAGLPDATWGALGEKIVADGGRIEGARVLEIGDEFVNKEAAPVDEAESFVHIGHDHAYHPTGGFWFPTGKKWGDCSGWVSSKYEIPKGELVQYPCDDREPEIRGRDDLPPWVRNRKTPAFLEGEEVCGKTAGGSRE